MEQEPYKGYIIKIEQDEYPEDPRGWDNLGKMICFNREYNLGDKHDYTSDDFNSWDELRERLEKDGVRVILPLCILDHSELWMRVGSSFNEDPGGWDTSRVGFIAAFDNDIRKEYNCRRITSKIVDKVEEILHAEVETYSKYISGDVVGYTIEDSDGNPLDSCWGYYDYNTALSDARAFIDHHIKLLSIKHQEQLKGYIKGKVLLQYRRSLSLKATGE